jgi:hypothetical protein
MRLKIVAPCTRASMPGQVKDPTQRWTVACSGLHTSGKNPIGLRHHVMMTISEPDWLPYSLPYWQPPAVLKTSPRHGLLCRRRSISQYQVAKMAPKLWFPKLAARRKQFRGPKWNTVSVTMGRTQKFP